MSDINFVVSGICVVLCLSVTTGCSPLALGRPLTPVPTQVRIPSQDLTVVPEDPQVARLVFYNDSNRALFATDDTGRLNITLDETAVGQLQIGQYLQLFVGRGPHTVDLVHKDVAYFQSAHAVMIEQPVAYVRIYATPLSNGLDVQPQEPTAFRANYAPAVALGKQLSLPVWRRR